MRVRTEVVALRDVPAGTPVGYGAISMDMSMIDVTDLPGVVMRDEAVVLGSQEGPLGKDFIGADEVAAHEGSISWEALTSISRRVPRFYRDP